MKSRVVYSLSLELAGAFPPQRSLHLKLPTLIFQPTRLLFNTTQSKSARALSLTSPRSFDRKFFVTENMAEGDQTAKQEHVKLKGSCFCGKCKIHIDGPVLFSTVCHCTNCQRISGGRSVHYLGFPSEGLKAEAPEGQLSGFKTSESMTRYFCATCHSPVYNQSHLEDMDFRDVASGVLERDEEGKLVHLQKEATQVKAHMFYPKRTADVADDLPRFDTYAL